jgi:DNA-binding transcriptional MerR regulator
MKLMQTGAVARLLGISGERVRQLEDSGRLSSIRTDTGLRLYLVEDVERLYKERTKRHANAGSH